MHGAKQRLSSPCLTPPAGTVQPARSRLVAPCPGHPDPAPGGCFPGSPLPRVETLPADFPAALSRHRDLVMVFVTGEDFLAFLPRLKFPLLHAVLYIVKGQRAFLPAQSSGMARWEMGAREAAELQSVAQPGWKCFGRLQAKTTLLPVPLLLPGRNPAGHRARGVWGQGSGSATSFPFACTVENNWLMESRTCGGLMLTPAAAARIMETEALHKL